MSSLRVDDKPGADTCFAVHAALEFMSAAFSAMSSVKDDLTPEILFGASRILEECADALKETKAARGGNGR